MPKMSLRAEKRFGFKMVNTPRGYASVTRAAYQQGVK